MKTIQASIDLPEVSKITGNCHDNKMVCGAVGVGRKLVWTDP